jgi:hypothetical protein
MVYSAMVSSQIIEPLKRRPTMSIKVTKFRPYQKNTLQGFVDLKMTKVGMEIRECTYHRQNGKEWVGLPARSYEKDGKTSWVPLVWFEKEYLQTFQKAARKAIHAYLEGGEGGHE